ncbi:hypothetical protein BDB01DRAFT_714980 [Pilobolus umbonatus]|nr:hypothetical protein BDB01DRAFT_714980 [Pilobolus umbonatus]
MVIKSPIPDIKMPETGIIEFLFNTPHNVPANLPIFQDAFTGEGLTYGHLKDNILRFAAGLQDVLGFKKGGATTPANPNYTPTELAYQLETAKASVLIVHPDNLETALTAADSVGLPRSKIFLFGPNEVKGVMPYTAALLSDRRAVPDKLSPEEAKEQVAYLCFSSGTTGKSKGVMTTHHNMVSNVCQYESLDKGFVDGNDRMIGVLPFFHIYSLSIILHVPIYLGISVSVMPRFDLPQFCETIQNKKVTFVCIAPPIALLLAKHPLISNYDMSSLRLIVCGAAPLGADLSRDVRKRLPSAIIKQGYGLTETSPFALIEPNDRVIDGSTGILLANMEARLVDENGMDVPTGERGELWLRGPNIMKGYLNNPQATADCIDSDRFFHTGDVAIQDKEGHFFIVDRIKELIKYKGFQVPPAELEALLLKSPLVDDCAVIGVYDAEQATEIPRGYIVLNSSVPANKATVDAIKKFIADQVVYYKQLRSIVFIDVIPKSPSGKILRRILRDEAAKEEKISAKL